MHLGLDPRPKVSNYTDEKERSLSNYGHEFRSCDLDRKLLECEIAETCLPPVALPKAHQSNFQTPTPDILVKFVCN